MISKNSKAGKVLLVDDEVNIIEGIKRYLEQEGLDVLTATDGEAALKLARQEKPDLIVLDLMLPKLDGLEVCRILRGESSVYIIMLTAKADEVDKMVGYAMGADSYVTKPFSSKVLVAKIKAALKRINFQKQNMNLHSSKVSFDGIEIDNKEKIIRKDNKNIELTGKEFDLLWYLASHPNQVFSRYQLLEEIWGDNFVGGADTITVHIRRLREKIEEDPSNPNYIKTVWGVGYKFEANK
ncbi:response regulator transcription factor [Halonatronum saccharophilum]|uniref:response regulator transcription factor n=1 Tax=Halonatronum saccharophilum TaxID=150060 RepID=UPI00047F80A5|nr:response regulator transcription factor [Halonatronum saccharophilum]